MPSSSNHIQKVAIVGAGGNIGSFMTENLLKTGKHTVTAITRLESTNTFPSGVEARKVNYDDHAALVQALKGEDALIVTMNTMAPPGQEKKIVEAAIEAGVPWILPNEWSPDTQDEGISKGIMIGDAKKSIRDLIEKSGTSAFIAVVTGFWYEWSVGFKDAFGLDFKNKQATLYDNGEQKISTSTWPKVGKSVAGLLSLPISDPAGGPCIENFKNNFVYISSFQISQRQMLESAARVSGTSVADWQINYEPSKERYQKGIEQLKGGDRVGFIKAMYVCIFFDNGAGNHAEKRGLQNDILGVSEVEDLDEATRIGMDRALGVNASRNGY